MPPTNRPTISHQPITPQNAGLAVKKWTKKRVIIWSISGLFTAVMAALIVMVGTYSYQLSALDTDLNKTITVQIDPGTSPAGIGLLLEKKQVIRSAFAFGIYTRIHGYGDNLQAGTYELRPSSSTPDIVDRLLRGDVRSLTITFLPGATLDENRTVLLNAGFSATEIDEAFAADYDSPLFDDKPATADLEGYLYGETYSFHAGVGVRLILQTVFEQYEQVIKENNLRALFKQNGLSLYQGITLASIIQREVSNPVDQRQVAQIFYLRLADGMQLGSDVTYQYAAKKLGVDPTPLLDSPYNTRRYTGLPPGPIATPGESALEAVANPAEGDYVYFLSGDDDITYFAKTNAEHEANIVQHCKVKCSVY